MLFNCEEQRAYDVQNFISTGSNIVLIIKKISSVEEDIKRLKETNNKIVGDIFTIKESIERFEKANGYKSTELSSKLDSKEREKKKVLHELTVRTDSLKLLQTEYKEYMKYIQESPYYHRSYMDFYKHIKIQNMLKDEFLTVLIVIFSSEVIHCGDKDTAIDELYDDCCQTDKEFKELMDSLKSVDDVVKYIKQNC